MKIPSISLWKSSAIACAVLCVAAIALGRMSAPAPTLRVVSPVRYVAAPSRTSADSDSAPGFLDLENGEIVHLNLPGDEALSNSSVSPWRDERGQGQVVGRWRDRSGRDESRLTTEFGLARYTFPGGEPLNRVATDILPEGPPCWYPGTGAKVLFAAADGTLYRFAFEGSTAPDATTGGCDPRPIPIVWKVAPPGSDERSVRISDPVWPEGKGFGGRVIVSLRFQRRVHDELALSPPQLWSLKLDREGSAIEAAAPLALDVAGSSGDGAETRERCPRAARTTDGIDRIIYLTRKPGHARWDLRGARVAPDADGTPRFAQESATLAQGRCDLSPPAFSSDGRWVYYLPSGPQEAGMHRVPSVKDDESFSRNGQ